MSSTNPFQHEATRAAARQYECQARLRSLTALSQKTQGHLLVLKSDDTTRWDYMKQAAREIHGLLTQLQSQTKRYFDLVEKGKRITETDGEMNLRQLGETICQILGFKSVMKDANTVSNWYWRYYGSKEDPGIYQKFITHSSNRKQYESQLQQELSRIDRQIETTKEQEAEWARQASAAQQRCRYAELAKPATPPRAPWRSSRSMIAAAS